MKKKCLFLISFLSLFTCSNLLAAPITISVSSVTAYGVGRNIGQITFADSKKGLLIVPNLTGLSPGPHAIHIHENMSCDSGVKDGAQTAALAAGAHLDPKHTGKHLGPEGAGHTGDLPVFEVDSSGAAKVGITAPHLKLSDIHKRSIVIHENSDNYSDTPKPLGGAGGRIACGVIP